ncbi:threonine/serine dehydratase [Acidiphilium sp. PA]|uniref:threonine ammonia-lyase n=1 Tax=Acidiphilium sp. PA TaxID=2871705 RepID=UPI0022441A58|nr:threonine/serine dehydratase [Acidiphilium sp. PA]MCW8307405.1 threonine/serine dehydratase [Acidiphilium sp. PA]
MTPTPDDVHRAAALIGPHIVRTPTLRSAALDQRTGTTAFVKAEPLQRTGSFKLRGATNALHLLPEAVRRHGVVTYSSGNHGQAIACAAAALGIGATIVMPADAPSIKREATAAWGATIVPFDRRTEDRAAIGRDIAARTGAALIPPFEHADVIAGQGTLALELVADARAAGVELDIMLVCTGGGGLTAGCALALQSVSPATRLIAVEPEGWDDTGRSLVAGSLVTNDGAGSPLCDALLAMAPGALTFSINQRLLAGAVAVADAAVLRAIGFAAKHLKLVVEPGGAVALAALLGEALPLAGLSVGVILSGGNIDPAIFARALTDPD